jgi:hypothetical protein
VLPLRVSLRQGPIKRLAIICLDRLGEGDKLRHGPCQRSGDPINRPVGRIGMAVLDVGDPGLVVSHLKSEVLLRDTEFFAA